MTTSWQRNTFRITGPSWGESTGHSHHKGPMMWRFAVSFEISLNKMLDNNDRVTVIWDALTVMWRHCNAPVYIERFMLWAPVPIEIYINILRSRQNGHHFPDDIFKCISLNEIVWISTNISQKFVPKGPITNIPSLVQIMAWRRLGDKPFSEPIMFSLPTHICVTRPQRVNNPSCPPRGSLTNC